MSTIDGLKVGTFTTLSTSNVNSNLIPASGSTYDLGSSSKPWNAQYIAGTITSTATDCLEASGTINSSAGQCIQATGTIFTTGVIGAGIQCNAPIFNVQGDTNQLVFTHSNAQPQIWSTINCPVPADFVTYTIPDTGSDSIFLFDKSLPWLASIPGWSLDRGILTSNVNGDNDIYTVPANSRAMIYNFAVYNGSASTLAWYPEVKISDTYVRLTANVSATTLARGTLISTFIYEAGETIAVNTNQTSCNVVVGVILFPDTFPLKTYRVTPSTTSQTLFTASVTNTYGLSSVFPLATSTPNITYVNGTGSSVTCTIAWTPNGGSSLNISNVSTATSSAIASTLGATLSSGDVLTITSSSNTAGQYAYVTLYEPS